MENEMIVKLSKPFNFEGEVFEEIDLSEIANLTTDQLCKAQVLQSDSNCIQPLTDFGYVIGIASIATEKPIEFFKLLPATDGFSIVLTIQNYFFN